MRDRIQDAIATIERDIKGLKCNLDAGRTATAALLLQDLARNISEQANEIMQDIIDALPEKERAARLAAYEYYKANCSMGDWESDYEKDPLVLECDCSTIAGWLADYFGEDVPAEIIKNLRAC